MPTAPHPNDPRPKRAALTAILFGVYEKGDLRCSYSRPLLYFC